MAWQEMKRKIPDWVPHSDPDAMMDEFSNRIGTEFLVADDSDDEGTPVYHYTSLSTAKLILESNKLRLTERTHLNDPTEVQYGINLGRQLLDRACRKHSFFMPLADRIKSELDTLFSSQMYHVACFSLDGDSLPQWRSYGDDGRGVALGFARPLHMNDLHVGNTRFRVRYDPRDLMFLHKYLIQFILTHYNTILGMVTPDERERRIERITRNVVGSLLFTSLYFKHRAYKFEREIRFMTMVDRDIVASSGDYKHMVRGSEIVHFVEYPLQWPPAGQFNICEIVVGPHAPPSLVGQLEGFVASLKKPFIKIRRSVVPYRSTA